VLQRNDVGIRARIGLHPRLLPLRDEFGNRAGRPEGRCLARISGLAAPGLDLRGELFPVFDGLLQEGDEPRRVEVDVRERGKQGLRGEDADFAVDGDPETARLDGRLSEPHEGQNQQILHRRRIGLLPADTNLGAPLAFCRLLALITEHEKPPLR